MDATFWHERWQRNEIGFHESKPNPLLVNHVAALGLAPGARVFVPLCGKSLDLGWLLGQGYRVAGAELSALAVEQLFAELGLVPSKTAIGALTRYSAGAIDIFVGDIFDLDAATLGPVAAVYDRAAYVALPPPLRARYAAHLDALTGAAPQLLVSFAYDQAQMNGPPFAIGTEEIHANYGARHAIVHLAAVDVPGGLKGRCAATEHVWLLR